MEDVRAAIRAFILETFFVSDEGETLDDAVSFLENGIVDSTGMLEVIEFLEESFALTVEDDELVPENLDSIDNLTRFVERKRSAGREGAEAAG